MKPQLIEGLWWDTRFPERRWLGELRIRRKGKASLRIWRSEETGQPLPIRSPIRHPGRRLERSRIHAYQLLRQPYTRELLRDTHPQHYSCKRSDFWFPSMRRTPDRHGVGIVRSVAGVVEPVRPQGDTGLSELRSELSEYRTDPVTQGRHVHCLDPHWSRRLLQP